MNCHWVFWELSGSKVCLKGGYGSVENHRGLKTGLPFYTPLEKVESPLPPVQYNIRFNEYFLFLPKFHGDYWTEGKQTENCRHCTEGIG